MASATETKIFADSTSVLVGVVFDFLSGPYQQKIEPLLGPVVEARNLSKEMEDWSTQVVDQLRATLLSLGELAGPEGKALVDQSGLTTELPPDVCLPVPGRIC